MKRKLILYTIMVLSPVQWLTMLVGFTSPTLLDRICTMGLAMGLVAVQTLLVMKLMENTNGDNNKGI